ncbi:EF-hand domain-containing protein [Streptomyces sp. NK08204]|uniref:EF-hand domain-containing protein n=1 Tax=Streptomyces sp. NK08204 TaxID=2873260 RepID=UPI001CECECC6|nr:EF-hand domain-containing protein [Streptomyces sp. NK08204]
MAPTAPRDPVDIKIGHVFDALDVDRDGYVEWADYESLIDRHVEGYGLARNDRRVSALMAAYTMLWLEFLRHADAEGDRLGKDEYIAANRAASIDTSRMSMTEGVPHAVFDLIDADDDHQMSRSEFSRYVKDVWRITAPDAVDTFDALDTDGDGLISRNEFILAVRQFFFSPDLDAPGSLFFGHLGR